jgi:cytochrome c-type biogenesis protein
VLVGAAAGRGGGGEAVALAARPRETGVPVLANGTAFVLGFSAVFVLFYYVLRALDVNLILDHRRTVNLVAGAIVIVLALQTLGLFRIGFLMREWRLGAVPSAVGLAPSFLLGVTFAAGWTPCLGPQLGAILTVAQQGDFAGLPVMLAYCLGLAIPFLLMAALTDRLQGVIRAVNRHLGAINLVAGGILLVFGLLLVFDRFTFFNQYAVQSPFDL